MLMANFQPGSYFHNVGSTLYIILKTSTFIDGLICGPLFTLSKSMGKKVSKVSKLDSIWFKNILPCQNVHLLHCIDFPAQCCQSCAPAIDFFNLILSLCVAFIINLFLREIASILFQCTSCPPSSTAKKNNDHQPWDQSSEGYSHCQLYALPLKQNPTALIIFKARAKSRFAALFFKLLLIVFLLENKAPCLFLLRRREDAFPRAGEEEVWRTAAERGAAAAPAALDLR